ncbi:MAG TPA: four helix bundle protein [Saprospiraceae bacterium]|nr:four helix bundle protein [Saprospiraceae bacterium]
MTNAEFNNYFCDRTKEFAVRIIRFVESLPFNTTTKVLGTQLCKSGTSTGANYRAFCRARSKNELFSKICIVVEEADENIYWLDLFYASKFGNKEDIISLKAEAEEILKVSSATKNSLFPK